MWSKFLLLGLKSLPWLSAALGSVILADQPSQRNWILVSLSSPTHYRLELSFEPGQTAEQIVARFGHQLGRTYRRIYQRQNNRWVEIDPQLTIDHDCSLRAL